MVMKTSYIFQLLISVCVLLGGISATAQNRSEPYETQAFSDRFRTIQTEVEGRELFPSMSWPKMSLICNTVLYIVMQIGVLPTCRIWNISMASIRILSKNMNFLLRLSRIMCITGLCFPMPMYSLKYRVIMCLWFIPKTNRKIFCCKCVFRSMKTKFWSLLL